MSTKSLSAAIAANVEVQDADKAIADRVQRTLQQLLTDCAAIQSSIHQQKQADVVKRSINSTKKLKGSALICGACVLMLPLLVGVLAARTFRLTALGTGSTVIEQAEGGSRVVSAIYVVMGMLSAVVLMCCGAAAATVKHQEPVLNDEQLQRLDEMSQVLSRLCQQAEILQDECLTALTERATCSAKQKQR